jgi:hypothetical protein
MLRNYQTAFVLFLSLIISTRIYGAVEFFYTSKYNPAVPFSCVIKDGATYKELRSAIADSLWIKDTELEGFLFYHENLGEEVFLEFKKFKLDEKVWLELQEEKIKLFIEDGNPGNNKSLATSFKPSAFTTRFDKMLEC